MLGVGLKEREYPTVKYFMWVRSLSFQSVKLATYSGTQGHLYWLIAFCTLL